MASEGPGDTEGYELLLVDRDALVRQLTTLAALAERCAGGQFYVLHNGV